METAVVVVAAAIAGGVAWMIVSADVVVQPVAFAVAVATSVVGLTVAGLAWRRARPLNPLGRHLLVLALVAALSAFAGTASPWPYLLGNVAAWAFVVGALAVTASFPVGRLEPPAKALFAIALVGFACIAFADALVAQSAPGAPYLGRCVADCPRNVLLVSSQPHAEHVLTVVQGFWRAGWGVAIATYLALRFARSGRPRRRIILPVYAVGGMFAVAFALNGIAVDVLGRSPVSSPAWLWTLMTARVVFPVGFLAALLLAYACAGTALVYMARRLGDEAVSVAAVEDIVRRVLDDRSARLAFWVPRFATYVDRHGESFDVGRPSSGRTWRTFTRRGEPMLAVEHDALLDDDAELVQAVGSATMIALENERLQRSLLDSITELRASRRRLVMAAATERRRIERDLHDSAQQKLVALRIQLELAREQVQADGPLRARLGRLGDDLGDALDELRAVAHGIYPQLLTDEGLTPALRDAVRRLAIPVRVDLAAVRRQSEEIEMALYYTCLEALQNAAKHGGDDVVATLEVREDGQSLFFRVADDGPGFSTARKYNGGGLTNMTDRIGAVGGSLSIRSTPGSGTTIEGRVPLGTSTAKEGAIAYI